MTRYIAFLRAINVGGKQLVKMEDLRRSFESFGLKNVRTFIQCGNVFFDTAETNSDLLSLNIETRLRKVLGYEVKILVRTLAELRALTRRSPFGSFERDKDVMLVVALLAEQPKLRLKLPLESAKENLEVLAVRNRAAFILCRRKKTGWFAFPNNFIEKVLAVPATTRQWKTLHRIVEAASADLDH